MKDGQHVDEARPNAVRYHPRRTGDYMSRHGMQNPNPRRLLDPFDGCPALRILSAATYSKAESISARAWRVQRVLSCVDAKSSIHLGLGSEFAGIRLPQNLADVTICQR
jgi:hypothetical protein